MSVYAFEDRLKAVKLYLQYDRDSAAVRRELGYPSKRSLKEWVAEFETAGALHDGCRARPPKYSEQQKRAAVDYYLQHGRSVRRTIKAQGYPNRATLRQWLNNALEGRRKLRSGKAGQSKEKLTRQQKENAIKDLCLRDGPAREVASQYGVTRAVLYKWKSGLLGKEHPVSKARRKKSGPGDDSTGLDNKVESLNDQVRTLEEEVYRLRLERDILEAAAEVIKKDQGTDLKKLTNREKTVVIGALRERYPLNELLHGLGLSKSSYFYQYAALTAGDKYAHIRERVRTAFTQAEGRYGYRRIHAIVTRDSESLSEKVVRRLMHEENLVVVVTRRRKYNSYKGEISPAVPNIIDRDFSADAPNVKWLTDLTEFQLPAGKVYLSPIIDCFDGLAVSWSIGTSPDAALVNTMLDEGTSALRDNEHPVLHSDRGSHYRWPGWIARTEAARLTRSMSKKSCTGDNAACEGFFGRVKNEMYYGRKWTGVSVEQFIDHLDRYLHWYNESRIKMSLGARSPMEYRRSLGYA